MGQKINLIQILKSYLILVMILKHIQLQKLPNNLRIRSKSNPLIIKVNMKKKKYPVPNILL